MNASVARQAQELHAAIDRFGALSERALRAVTDQDVAALAAALDAREEITARIGVLTGSLAQSRRGARSGPARDGIDTLLLPVQRLAATALQLNDALESQAQRSRADIREQLDRLTHDDAARAAYASASLPGDRQRVDIKR
ncbi:MAG: hypothetical protein ABIP66_03680 [Gemmatimonadaceae bacterium]